MRARIARCYFASSRAWPLHAVGLLVFLELLVFLVLLVFLENLVLLVLLVFLENLVLLVLLVFLVLLETLPL